MKKEKVHKDDCYNVGNATPCGLPEYINLCRSKEWKGVTCKNCLKKKSKVTSKDLQDMYTSVTQIGSNLTKEDIIVAPPDEVWDEEECNKKTIKYPEKTLVPKMTPLEKWEQWFQLSEDHVFSPSSSEVWDGAIDTICAYLKNELCTFHDVGLHGAEGILNKTKKKFKEE